MPSRREKKKNSTGLRPIQSRYHSRRWRVSGKPGRHNDSLFILFYFRSFFFPPTEPACNICCQKHVARGCWACDKRLSTRLDEIKGFFPSPILFGRFLVFCPHPFPTYYSLRYVEYIQCTRITFISTFTCSPSPPLRMCRLIPSAFFHIIKVTGNRRDPCTIIRYPLGAQGMFFFFSRSALMLNVTWAENREGKGGKMKLGNPYSWRERRRRKKIGTASREKKKQSKMETKRARRNEKERRRREKRCWK